MSEQSKRKSRKVVSKEVVNLKTLKKMGYHIGKRIGEGAYSKVCLATRNLENSHTKLACKIINRNFAGVEFIKRFLPRELKIVAMIDHPNIVTVSNIIELNRIIYMFMDYCQNGDMLEYIRENGPLTENKARYYFRQLVNAVDYLHSKELAHRDLKCENILLTVDNCIKIGDFGFARSCVNKLSGKKIMSETFCGSAAYAAPEILKGIPYDPKMYDIWAMGCILYIMLTASMPFDDTNIKRMLKSQMSKSICYENFKEWELNSSSLLSLLQHLLEPNVKKRLSIKQVADSQWLQEFGFKKCNVV